MSNVLALAATWLLRLAICAAVTACAALVPYVDRPQASCAGETKTSMRNAIHALRGDSNCLPAQDVQNSEAMPRLARSIQAVDVTTRVVSDMRWETGVSRRGLEFLTFGLVSAMGVHSIHGDHTAAIKN